MRNSTRKTALLGFIVLAVVIGLWATGLLQVGGPVAYAPTAH